MLTNHYIDRPTKVELSGTPTMGGGAANGTGQSVSITAGSNDVVGEGTVTVGSSGTTTGETFSITFASPYPAAPRAVFLMPRNSTSPAVQAYVSSITLTKFIVSVAVAPTASSTLKFSYLVVQ